MRKLILSIVAMAFGLSVAHSQNFNLSKFTNSSGLPQNYVYSLAQDPNGFVWIATTEGLSRYDGIRFTNYSRRDSLADEYVSQLLIDTDQRLWCGHGNGWFSVYEDNHFIPVRVSGVSAPIKDMCVDDKGNIWAVEQNKGLIKIDPNKEVTTYFDRSLFGRRKFYSVRAINSLTLLVGTSDGLLLVKLDVDGTLREPTEVNDIASSTINCIEDTYNRQGYWIGTADGEIYRYALGKETVLLNRCTDNCNYGDMPQYDVRSICEREDGTLYIGTWGDGVRMWAQSKGNEYSETLELNEENGLGNNHVSDILVDREGILWFATYGGGVIAWINNYFAQYNLADIGFHRNKVLAAEVIDQYLWLTLNNGILKMDVRCATNFEYFDQSMGLPSSAITALTYDKETGIQYFGTESSGVYFKHKDSYYFQRLGYAWESNTQKMINSMAFYKGKLYLATQGGFIVYDAVRGTTRNYTTIDGLSHNNINFVYIDDDGQIWLGPKDSGVAQFVGDKFEIHRLSDIPANVAGMTHDQSDRFWIATFNNGILCNSNDSIVAITSADGLEKNYCYGIATDGNNRIWVCHQPGLSCIDLATGNVRTFNFTNGLGQEFTGVSRDENGDLWFSSSSGVVHYMSTYDRRSNTPPIINLTKIQISGKRHDLSKPIDLGYPYGGNLAKFEFDFVGICMKDPLNVRYEYWLDMHDDKGERWMPLGTQNHKEFDFLPDGDYTLHVRAFNSDGIMCANPLLIDIHIDAPFWKTGWFLVSLAIILLLGGRIITKWRESKMRERQKILEDEVARQTSLLNKQKAVIERKNNDIMDSINYAKNIQTAILPTRTSMKDFPFTDSFILFLPRDVVSGDFYWFARFDNKVIVCCGDCTGHGVPGAFMTMIGTTILNDATRDEELRKSPSKLLERLDKNIKNTLNKNQVVEAQDGMDCALVVIDLDTFEICSAAAHRPVYIFEGEQLTELRATRRSIGDRRNGNEFIESRMQLKKGDSIYMSSDGFTDQFGGDKGEKYTSGAFKRFIQSVKGEPMEDQVKLFEAEFNRWKGEREQIDDVIVMGIKL